MSEMSEDSMICCVVFLFLLLQVGGLSLLQVKSLSCTLEMDGFRPIDI